MRALFGVADPYIHTWKKKPENTVGSLIMGLLLRGALPSWLNQSPKALHPNYHHIGH